MDKKQWVALGITAFLVISGALVVHYVLTQLGIVWSVLVRIGDILRPVMYALVFTFLLTPVHRGLMKWQKKMLPTKYSNNARSEKWMNVVAVILSLLFAVLLIYALLALLLPQLYLSVVGLIAEIPTYAEELQNWLVRFLEDNPYILSSIMSYYDALELQLMEWINGALLPNLSSIEGLIEWIKTMVISNLTGVVSNVYAVVATVLMVSYDLGMGLIITIYLLARKNIFCAQAKKIIYSSCKTSVADRIIIEVRDAYRILSGFVNGKLLDSLIVGIITFIAFQWMEMPYGVLLATIIGITNIIPYFGPFIGGIPCGVLVLLVDPMKCLYFAIFVIILQQVDGNIIGPKILGDSTGLASFWVIFSILLFGGLFGFGGMLLGVPVFAMFYNITNKLVRRGLRQRGLPTQTEDYMGKTGPLAK